MFCLKVTPQIERMMDRELNRVSYRQSDLLTITNDAVFGEVGYCKVRLQYYDRLMEKSKTALQKFLS